MNSLHIQLRGLAEKFSSWEVNICCWWLIWQMGFKHSNTNRRSKWTAGEGTMLKNKSYLVIYEEYILAYELFSCSSYIQFKSPLLPPLHSFLLYVQKKTKNSQIYINLLFNHLLFFINRMLSIDISLDSFFTRVGSTDIQLDEVNRYSTWWGQQIFNIMYW